MLEERAAGQRPHQNAMDAGGNAAQVLSRRFAGIIPACSPWTRRYGRYPTPSPPATWNTNWSRLAAVVLGLITRATRDLDIVAMVERGQYVAAVRLPDPLTEAVRDIGAVLGIGADWLNAGPAALLDFGLPEGFADRTEVRDFGALTLHLASRVDQIYLKLYAAVDQGPTSKHVDDLRALSPSADELRGAAAWAQTHDSSPAFADELRAALRLFGVDVASTYSDEVHDLVLGTLWSLWAELGLSGWERRHQRTAIDLEALLLTTARLGHLDARLLAEALDWSVANGRLASAVRIKHLAAAADSTTQRAMSSFAATVNANSQLRWPDAGMPGAFVPTGRSAAPALDRPALVQLRLRALWGVSARAEVLRVMLEDGHRFMGVSEVAIAAAFGKDAVAEALDNLHRGGLLEEAGARNQRVFRLGGERDLAALVGVLPERAQNWPLVLPIMVGFLDAAELPPMAPLARAADVRRRLRVWQPNLARLGVVTGALQTGVDFLDDYEEFTLRALRVWTGVTDPAALH